MLNPNRSRWREDRAEMLRTIHGESSPLLSNFFRISSAVPLRRIVYSHDDAGSIIDHGALVKSTSAEYPAINAMLELAKLKGWKTLEFQGTEQFRRDARHQALQRGFNVTGADMIDEARAPQARIGRERLHDGSARGRQLKPKPPGY